MALLQQQTEEKAAAIECQQHGGSERRYKTKLRPTLQQRTATTTAAANYAEHCGSTLRQTQL